MFVKTIIPVVTEPISLLDLKQHLRLPDDSSEDELLLRLIGAARAYCEHYTRRALAEQTLEGILDRFPETGQISIPCPPLRNVLSIIYKEDKGTESTLLPDSYIVDVDTGRVVPNSGTSWPVFAPYPVSPIRIRFVAGYGTLPNTIQQALLMLVGHWYENREATGTVSGEIAFSVHALLAPYRVEAF